MKSSVTEAMMSIVLTIAIVGVFLLWAFAANAGTNSYNGCVLAMTGITIPGGHESDINEQWCIRFRESFRDMSPKDTDQYLMCALTVGKIWQKSHQGGDKQIPDAAGVRIMKGCAMMIFNISEDQADAITRPQK